MSVVLYWTNVPNAMTNRVKCKALSVNWCKGHDVCCESVGNVCQLNVCLDLMMPLIT